ncbi:hypothetical protein FNV43_RR05037 [Rhamnella rubrinervis]|uniref:Uncharacterized protein n=1 Tax=Rhamnella rubrinervis TaxID=2594499 RepID=A0A8K0HN75_9ROSA|nr:hypothetical protein FNV43_RR05037 [Rhamnella rubrinervis]
MLTAGNQTKHIESRKTVSKKINRVSGAIDRQIGGVVDGESRMEVQLLLFKVSSFIVFGMPATNFKFQFLLYSACQHRIIDLYLGHRWGNGRSGNHHSQGTDLYLGHRWGKRRPGNHPSQARSVSGIIDGERDDRETTLHKARSVSGVIDGERDDRETTLHKARSFTRPDLYLGSSMGKETTDKRPFTRPGQISIDGERDDRETTALLKR